MSSSHESIVGSIMKLVDEAHPTYPLAWVIDHPDYCCDVKYKSPEFSTGPSSKQNVWQLAFETSGNVDYRSKFCVQFGHTYIHLRSSKEPGVTKKVAISVLGAQGEKFFERIHEIVTVEDERYLLYLDKSKTKELCEINHDRLIICCKIYDCTPTSLVKISHLVSSNSQGFDMHHRMANDFEALMNNQRLCDATLVVGGQEFHVHKAILASRSPVFMATFENDMREKQLNKVHILDVRPDVVQKLLSYIYTDRVQNVEESAKDLIAAAEKYQIEGLKFLCARSLMESLNEQNAIETLILADLYRIDDLKNQTYNFIAVSVKNVQDLDGYDCLEESGRADLLEALSAIGAVRVMH